MTRLIENDQILVYKYTESIVNGRVQKTLIGNFTYKACVQPVDLSEFAPEAADRENLVVNGNTVKSYKKVYTKAKLCIHDIVIYEGKRFKLMRVSDYSKFVQTASHYRYVIVSTED